MQVGFSNEEIQIESDWGNLLKNASRLFFNMNLRKLTYFFNFSGTKYFETNAHRLRMFDLMILKGNKIKEVKGSGNQSTVTASTFSGEKVFLGDNLLPGPYTRFTTNSQIASYSERLQLRNLVVDLGKFSIPQKATIGGCLHQIDSGHCLVCQPNLFAADNHRSCSVCPSGSIRQNIFDKCILTANTSQRIDNSRIFGNVVDIKNKNVYNLGGLITRNMKVFGHFQLNLTPSISNLKISNFLPGTIDNRIYFFRLKMKYLIPNKSTLQNVSLRLNLQSASNSTSIKNEFDSRKLSSADDLNESESLFAVYRKFANPSSQFLKVNFISLSHETDQVQLDLNISKTFIEYVSLSESELMANLDDFPLSGKRHSVYFPLNYFDKQNVYIPSGMFEYVAKEHDSTAFPQNFHISKDVTILFVKSCSTGCKGSTCIGAWCASVVSKKLPER